MDKKYYTGKQMSLSVIYFSMADRVGKNHDFFGKNQKVRFLTFKSDF